MLRSRSSLCLLMITLLSLPMLSTNAQAAPPYKAETTLWRAADSQFASWQRDAVSLLPDGTLRLDPRSAHPGTDPYAPGKYKSGNFYNGGTFVVGEATGPIITPAFPFSEAVPSWNADTPPGTWGEVQLRARTTATRWTRWYTLGIWASTQDSITRHSVTAQTDANAYVDVDTLKLGKRGKPPTSTAYQLKIRLFTTTPNALPTLHNAAVVVSTKPAAPAALTPGNPTLWNKFLPVPQCSQMVYPDGGEVWCSPTSVAMVLGYWAGRPDSDSCNADVRAAVSGVYDRIYKGHGNWPFNTAYAANHGMEAYVTRFTSLSQAEQWIAAGVPVIMSVSWAKGQLTNAPVSSTAGHLIVLVGFDPDGNPIVNDPAAPANESVRRTYLRPQLEKLWLQASGGTVYLIYPADKIVPKL
jgi:uncharacterized protein YvpB